MSPNIQEQKRKDGIKFIRVYAFVFLVILALVLFMWWQSSGKGITEEPKYEKYLNEKYGKRFVVSNYRIEGAGIGVKGVPVVDAYPVDDPDLRFDVVDRGNNTFADGYAHKYWSKQGKEPLQQEISNRMPEIRSVGLYVTGGLQQNFFTLRDYPYKNSVPDLLTVLKDHPNKLKVDLGVHSATFSVVEEPSSNELMRAHEVMKYAKELGIINGSIGYTYTHQDYSEKNPDGSKVPRYSIIVPADKLAEITSPQQLEQYFKDRSLTRDR